MESTDVTDALEVALTEVLDRPVSNLTGEVRLFEDLQLDSTSMLEMLMALEDSIGLVVEPEDIDVDDFESVDTFIKFVQSSNRANAEVSS